MWLLNWSLSLAEVWFKGSFYRRNAVSLIKSPACEPVLYNISFWNLPWAGAWLAVPDLASHANGAAGPRHR